MQQLRLVAVSEDGSYAVLDVPGRGGRFSLRIDDRFRALARGQFARLAQYEIEVECPLRPKEIQERIRAGETADEIADATGVPVERVRWFEGPVLAERAYRAQEAQSAMVRRPGDSGPGPRLGDVVTERLAALGASAEEARWDSRKRGDGCWQVLLAVAAGGGQVRAEWVYDPRRRHVTPTDEGAALLSLPERDVRRTAGQEPARPGRGEATVTQLQRRAAPGTAGAGPAGAGPAGLVPVARPGHWAPDPAQDQPARSRSQQGADRRAERERAGQGRAQGRVAEGSAASEPDEAAAAASAPPRRAAGGRARRSSVPSWDEIMLGSSRPRD